MSSQYYYLGYPKNSLCVDSKDIRWWNPIKSYFLEKLPLLKVLSEFFLYYQLQLSHNLKETTQFLNSFFHQSSTRSCLHDNHIWGNFMTELSKCLSNTRRAHSIMIKKNKTRGKRSRGRGIELLGKKCLAVIKTNMWTGLIRIIKQRWIPDDFQQFFTCVNCEWASKEMRK